MSARNQRQRNTLQDVRASLTRRVLPKRSDDWRSAQLAHVVSLIVGYVVLLWLNRDGWFFADDWDFLTDRGFAPEDAGLFEPHNEHWSTIPILIFRGLFSIFGLRTYLPYISVLLILHVAVVHLLWRTMRVSGVDPWIATGASAMFLVFGAGFENILWAFQIGFVGAVLCGLGHVLLVDHAGSFGRRDVAGWALSLIGLMFSGIAVPMIATAGIVALIRRGWKALMLTVAPAAAVYVVWLVTVGREGLGSHPAPAAGLLLRLPLYVAAGVRDSIEGIATIRMGIQVFLPIILLLGAIGLMRGRSGSAAPVACAIGSIFLFAITGIGRLALYEGSLSEAGSSRYVYIAAAFLLPLIALGLTIFARTAVPARIAVFFFIILGVVTSFRTLLVHAGAEAERKQFILSTALAAVEPSAFDGPLLGNTPLPRNTEQFSSLLTLDELVALRANGALPDIQTISDEARLQAAANLQVSLSGEPQLTSDDRSAVLVAGISAPIEGCASFHPGTSIQRPTAVIDVSEPVSLGIRSERGGEIEVLIRRDETLTPVVRTFGLLEERTSFLNLGIPGSQAIVKLPPVGLTTVCNLRLS